MTLKIGDRISIQYNGRTVPGEVTLASKNGLSLMIEFDAMLGGHVGTMPVTMKSVTEGFSIIDGTLVTIKKAYTGTKETK